MKPVIAQHDKHYHGNVVDRVDVFTIEFEPWFEKVTGDGRPNPEDLLAEAEDPSPEQPTKPDRRTLPKK